MFTPFCTVNFGRYGLLRSNPNCTLFNGEAGSIGPKSVDEYPWSSVEERPADSSQVKTVVADACVPPSTPLPITCTGRRICALADMLPSGPPWLGEVVKLLIVGV